MQVVVVIPEPGAASKGRHVDKGKPTGGRTDRKDKAKREKVETKVEK